MNPLRRRMIEDMQIRNLTPNTQRVYVAQVVHFACHFRKSPNLLGPPEIRAYLIHLTRERRLTACSIIVTVSALRFLYTVTLKRPWVARACASSVTAPRLSDADLRCPSAGQTRYLPVPLACRLAGLLYRLAGRANSLGAARDLPCLEHLNRTCAPAGWPQRMPSRKSRP
jgi:hypothetical protein